MIELLFSLIPPGLAIWIPVLIVIGYLLKHGSAFPNGFIALALFGIAAAVSVIYGYMATEGMATPLRVSEVLIAYGLGYGFLLAFAAVFFYDTVHGAMKQIRKRNGGRNAGEEHVTAPAKEESMEMTEKEKGKKKFRMTSFLTYLLVVIGSVVLGTLMALPWGIGPALDFISKAIFLAVIMVLAADAAFKIRYERWKLLWQYWAGLALVLGADWCFLWASMTTTWGMMALALGCVALLGIGAGAWFLAWYGPKVAAKKEAYLAEYEQALVEKGVDAETAADIAKNAKEDER